MKRIKLIISLIIFVTILVSLGSGLANAGDFVVGLSWNEKKHALIQAWEDYMKQISKEYGKEHGINFKWIVNVADSDPIQQNSNITDLISLRVNVIVARAHDAAAIGAAIKEAQKAGIPFVTFDRECATVVPTAHVGADSYTQGLTTALYFAGLVKGMGIKVKVIELMGDLRDMNAVYRHNAWHEIEKQLGLWETVIEVPTEWNPEKFYSGTVSAFRAHPEANAMFVASDFCFKSVESGIRDAGRKLVPPKEKDHIWIAAQDINPHGYEAMLKGYIDVATTYDAYFHAKQCVEVLGMIAEGKDLKGQKFLVSGRVATPDNLKNMKNVWARDYKD
jgi:ABC-type sugar transport system substrate-binding protein